MYLTEEYKEEIEKLHKRQEEDYKYDVKRRHLQDEDSWNDVMKVKREKFDKECMEIPIFKYFDSFQLFQRISCASNEDIVLIKEKLCSGEMYYFSSSIGYFHPIQTYYTGELLLQCIEPIEKSHTLVWKNPEELIGKMVLEIQSWAIEQAIK